MNKLSIKYRALLTETLPFEVPIIFSNNVMHSSLSLGEAATPVSVSLRKARRELKEYTKPYSYEIAKSDARTTTLGIIHPIWQKQIAEFYERHSSGLLDYCANERFTLRRPTALATPFYAGSADDDEDASRLKLGLAQMAADAGEPDVTHMTSYFVYKKYNLLGKFVDAREYRRLESRFRFQRRLDISKCFYNIYTHSIAWAIKGKEFSKEFSKYYSMESEMDTIMQKCNYNETNGIVVGPEFSRIFAEIILQNVDACVQSELEHDFYLTRDYDVRRYVDDYFIYANDERTLDFAEQCIRRHLEKYKLFINEQKVETTKRPFVTDLTKARRDVGASLSEISKILSQIKEAPLDPQVGRWQRQIRALVGDMRVIVSKYKVGFETVSGWLLSRIHRSIRFCIAVARDLEFAEERDPLIFVATDLLEATFHILALDVRVRPTYSISQIILSLFTEKSLFRPEQWDSITHLISDECLSLLRTMIARKIIGGSSKDSVEAFNLMICGAHFCGVEFLRADIVVNLLSEICSATPPSYFAYISTKFCLLKDRVMFQILLDQLNEGVNNYLIHKADIFVSSEDYLLWCDYLSSPDVDPALKRQVVNRALGGDVSKATANSLGLHLGFVDWTGLSVEHLLTRKRLRPVYAWG